MGTRSDIIVEKEDGKFYKIYCHWDGYLSYNGKLLLNYYNTQERANFLVDNGDISSLKKTTDCPLGHTFDTPATNCTVFYGRDRGETDAKASVYESRSDAIEHQHDYTYLFTSGTWWHIKGNSLIQLTEKYITAN